MKPNLKQAYLTQLSALCDQPYSLRVKIALLSFKKTPSFPFLEPILLIFEYFQILSAFLFFGLQVINRPQNTLFDILSYVSKLINPAYWISFDEIQIFEMTIMGIVAAFTLSKYLLFGYITLLASERVRSNNVLKNIWRFIFKTQGRMIYHILISFWIAIINSLQANKDTENNAKYVILFTVSCLMILLETILTLHLNLYFCYILPTKSLLSQKDNTIDIINILHKLIIQLLTTIFTTNSTKLGLWIFTLFNLLADLLRYFYFFTILPFYKFKALTYQLTLMMLITAFNVSYFVICIVQYTDYEISQYLSLLIISWIILSILALKLSHGSLQGLFWRILADPNIKSPYLLVHRVQAIRQLRKSVRPHFEYNDNYSWTLLANKTLNQHTKTILRASSEGEDLNDKASAKLIFKQYLEGLIAQYSNDKFIRLYLVQFYIKSLKEIQEPIKIGISLYKTADRRIKFNLQMLVFDIENNIQTRYLQLGKEKDHLDLSQFIKEQALYAQIKQKIVKQATLQTKICDELRKDHSDIAIIFNDAQVLSKHRKKTLALINNSLTKFSEFNIEPLLLFSHYHLTLNHSVKDSHHFSHIYSKRYARYQRFYSQENLVKENMFQSHAGFYLLKTNEFDAGNIAISSKSMSRMLERDPENPSNLNAFHSAPPCQRSFYAESFKEIGKKGEKVLLDKITPGFLYTESGYLIQTEYYMNIHPFITNGLFSTLVIRPTLSKNDYMYILENGSIDSTTKNIGQLLKISPNSKETSPGTNFHLRNISKELAVVNQAFNIIFHSGVEFSPEINASSTENNSQQIPSFNSRQTSKQSMSLDQARQIYSVYSTTGKDIFLIQTQQTKGETLENIGYLYNCRVMNLQLGSTFLKLFTLVRKGKAQKFQGDHSFGTFYTEDIEDIDVIKTHHHHHHEHEETMDLEENIDEFNNHPTARKPTQLNITTTTRLHADTSRNFLLTSRDVPHQSPMLTFQAEEEPPVRREDVTDSPSFHPEVENLEHQNARIVKPLKQSRTGTLLSSSHENRMADLYLASLDVKFVPKILKRLEIFFYLVMLNTLILQIPLKIVADNNLKSIRTNKDILRSAQSRNQKLITIQSMTGIIWDLDAGVLNSTDFGPLAPYMLIIPHVLSTTIRALSESNQVLLENTNALTISLRLVAYMGIAVEIILLVNRIIRFNENFDLYDDENN